MSSYLVKRLAEDIPTNTKQMDPDDFFMKFKDRSFIYNGLIGHGVKKVTYDNDVIFKSGTLEKFCCSYVHQYYLKRGFIHLTSGLGKKSAIQFYREC